jgi:hypothetical protein
VLFAYFGPETLMPLTSIVAGVVGVFLMFGRNTLRFAVLAWNRLTRLAGLARDSRAGEESHSSVPGRPRSLERRRARARQSANTGAEQEHGQ